MDVIKLLPDSVANQIAAGEVIQRPSSAVKELVENAIDAGATQVKIVIKGAGKTLIQVIDNGCGMSSTDARLAFARHATSKIRSADDLFTLHTMGFRGEALPSIAAIAEVEMRTMRKDDQLGTRLIIKASQVESQEPEVCVPGTSIMVRNLFFNVVARRRFLKADKVEMSHINHEFERLVLVNTDVEFTLTQDGRLIHQLPKAPLKQRIGQLFGRTVENGLIPIETQTSSIKISGFIGLPSTARQRNALQFFFVNGRNMRHPMFHKAVLNCYKDLISGDVQPNYFISFEVEPDRIDVNIHPQKHEIKFEDESMLWQILTSAVKESLGKYNVGPAIDFNATDVPDIPPLLQGAAPTSPVPVNDELDPHYNPFEIQPPDFEMQRPPSGVRQSSLFGSADDRAPFRRERQSALNNGNWEKLYQGFMGETGSSLNRTSASSAGSSPLDEQDAEAALEAAPVTVDFDADTLAATPLVQLKNRWIVTSTKAGLLIVDQHRAHLRMLYEQILPQVKSGHMTSQKLIFPDEVELDAGRHQMLADALELLGELGFDVQPVRDMTWAISAVPTELGSVSPREALLALLSDLTDTGADPSDEQRQRIALSMARTAAIRNNQPLAAAEMQTLVADLFRLSTPNYTPDGYATLRIISAAELASYFHK